MGKVIIVVLVLVYLASCYLWWKYVNLSYSKGGQWSMLLPDCIEVMIMLVPFLNTFFLSLYITDPPMGKPIKHDDGYVYRKFFRIKK